MTRPAPHLFELSTLEDGTKRTIDLAGLVSPVIENPDGTKTFGLLDQNENDEIVTFFTLPRNEADCLQAAWDSYKNQ
jgi:hypothetical protein